MKRSDRFDKLADINRNYETIAGKSFSSAQTVYQHELNQLHQLEIYREEYAERYREMLKNPVQPEAIKDYRFFFTSLEEAISVQQSRVRKCQQAMEHSQLDWIDSKNEVRKVTTLADRARVQENLEQDRQERNELDDLNQTRLAYYG